MNKSILIILLLSLTLCQTGNYPSLNNFSIVNHLTDKQETSMPNPDTYLYYLKTTAEKTNAKADIDAYHHEIAMIEKTKKIFDLFSKEFNLPQTRTRDINYDCLRMSIETFKSICGYDKRDMQFFSKFSIACSLPKIPTSIEISSFFKIICNNI